MENNMIVPKTIGNPMPSAYQSKTVSIWYQKISLCSFEVL